MSITKRSMFDEDTYTAIKREEEGQRKEDRELKNRILNMNNPLRKMKEWQKYFPKPVFTNNENVY